MLSRRSFLKSAAGLLVASTALAVPEKKVWALDSTMIAPDRTFTGTVTGFDGELREAMLRNKLLLEQSIITLDKPSFFNKWDVVSIDGEYMMITSDPLDSAEVTVVRDLYRAYR